MLPVFDRHTRPHGHGSQLVMSGVPRHNAHIPHWQTLHEIDKVVHDDITGSLYSPLAQM